MENPAVLTLRSRSPGALLSLALPTTTTTAASVRSCTQKEQLLTCSPTTNPHSLPPLGTFIATVFLRSNLPPSVCLVSLIYLQRLKAHLSPLARGNHDTPYRLFIAAIMTASKFMLEPRQSLTNKDIAIMVDYCYTPKDINSMERSFLGLIEFDLFVTLESIKDYLAMHGTLFEMDLVEQALDH